MRSSIAVTLLLIAATASAQVEMRYLQAIGDVRYERIESRILERGFHIFVRLPDDYDTAEGSNYPTVYVLDGDVQFPTLASYHWYLNLGDELPDVIIVGIAYGAITVENGNYRSTDFTAPAEGRDDWGGAVEFQRFLSDELIPHVESSYRSREDRRIIFGQSLGGQLVLYTALTKPDLFWGHIASNPALHRNLAFFLEHHASTDSASKVFVASGSRDTPRYREPAVQWIEHWSSRENLPWQLQTVTLDGHTHVSAPPASYRQGMTWLFAGVSTGEAVD